jgi:hypothetical protein
MPPIIYITHRLRQHFTTINVLERVKTMMAHDLRNGLYHHEAGECFILADNNGRIIFMADTREPDAAYATPLGDAIPQRATADAAN